MDAEEIKFVLLKGRDRDTFRNSKKIFGYEHSNENLEKHLDAVRELDISTIILAIARMDKIETEFDHSKSLAITVSLVAIMFTIYKSAFSIAIVIFLASFSVLLLLYNMDRERKIRKGAVYLRSILQQVKEEKQKENETNRCESINEN